MERRETGDVYLHTGQHETVPYKVCRVSHAFTGLETKQRISESDRGWINSPVEVRLLLLDVDRVEGVEPEPGGEGEAGLVRPLGQRRDHHGRPRLARETEEDVRSRPETGIYHSLFPSTLSWSLSLQKPSHHC